MYSLKPRVLAAKIKSESICSRAKPPLLYKIVKDTTTAVITVEKIISFPIGPFFSHKNTTTVGGRINGSVRTPSTTPLDSFKLVAVEMVSSKLGLSLF